MRGPPIKKAAPKLWTGAVSLGGLLFCNTGTLPHPRKEDGYLKERRAVNLSCVQFGQLRCGVHDNVNHAGNMSRLSGANITKSILGPARRFPPPGLSRTLAAGSSTGASAKLKNRWFS
jgi:hypothetical protein